MFKESLSVLWYILSFALLWVGVLPNLGELLFGNKMVAKYKLDYFLLFHGGLIVVSTLCTCESLFSSTLCCS